jgi:hypothetical protein
MPATSFIHPLTKNSASQPRYLTVVTVTTVVQHSASPAPYTQRIRRPILSDIRRARSTRRSKYQALTLALAAQSHHSSIAVHVLVPLAACPLANPHAVLFLLLVWTVRTCFEDLARYYIFIAMVPVWSFSGCLRCYLYSWNAGYLHEHQFESSGCSVYVVHRQAACAVADLDGNTVLPQACRRRYQAEHIGIWIAEEKPLLFLMSVSFTSVPSLVTDAVLPGHLNQT